MVISMNARYLFSILFLAILVLSIPVIPVFTEDSKQAVGKILLYKIMETQDGKIKKAELVRITVLIINDNEVYMDTRHFSLSPMIEGLYLRYDPSSNTLEVIYHKIEETRSTEISEFELEYLTSIIMTTSPILPKSLVEKLPSLKTIKYSMEVIRDGKIEKITGEATLSQYTVKKTSYNGVTGIEVSTIVEGEQITSFVREDGIRIYTKTGNITAIQLLAEDDIGKAKQTSSPAIAQASSRETTTTKNNTSTTYTSTTMLEKKEKPQTIPLSYIMAVLIIIVIIIIVFLLKKR